MKWTSLKCKIPASLTKANTCDPNPYYHRQFTISPRTFTMALPSQAPCVTPSRGNHYAGYSHRRLGVMGWTVFSQNSYVEALAPGPQNVAVFGGRTFQEVMKVKWGHMGGPWSSITGVLRRRDQDTHMHMNGRKTTWGHREKMAIYKPRRGLRRNQPCPNVDLGLLASRTVRK